MLVSFVALSLTQSSGLALSHLAYNAFARQRRVGDQAQACARDVIDHDQDPNRRSSVRVSEAKFKDESGFTRTH